MPSMLTERFRVHNARQFVESIGEGIRDYTSTVTTTANSTTVTVSANIYSTVRTGDTLLCVDAMRRITDVTANGTQLTIETPFGVDITAETFSIAETAYNTETLYLFIGRPTPWSTGDATVDDVQDSVSNTTFDYWRDIIAFHKITKDDFIHVIPRHTWTTGETYAMYDSRVDTATLVSNSVFYVINSTNKQVFKCLYNGTTPLNANGVASNEAPVVISTELPGQVISLQEGNYNWKYLFTVTDADAGKFLTSQYIPVRAVYDTLDTISGDVYDDGSLAFKVFDDARSSFSNGAIHQILVTNAGSGYTNTSEITVTIDGDGIGAEAVVPDTLGIVSGGVQRIIMSNPGRNYSWATVTIACSNTQVVNATAVPIMSPRNQYSNTSGVYYASSHGIDPEEELGAKYVMLYAELTGRDTANAVPIGNDYRRIGIIRNPILYGTNTLAQGVTYSQTTDITCYGLANGNFTLDEIVWQQSTNAYGVVVEIDGSVLKLAPTYGSFETGPSSVVYGIGNGSVNGHSGPGGATLRPTPSVFSPTIPASGAQAYVESVVLPDIQPFSGDILMVEHHAPITRSENQTEIIRTVLSF